MKLWPSLRNAIALLACMLALLGCLAMSPLLVRVGYWSADLGVEYFHIGPVAGVVGLSCFLGWVWAIHEERLAWPALSLAVLAPTLGWVVRLWFPDAAQWAIGAWCALGFVAWFIVARRRARQSTVMRAGG